jgi:co-chaperonin GroES (HSP10)
LGFSDSKIFIPSLKAAQKMQPFTLAVILNTGKGYRNIATGEWKGTDLKAGDVVIAEQFVAFPIEIDGRNVNYFPESVILAKVDDYSLDNFEDKVL